MRHRFLSILTLLLIFTAPSVWAKNYALLIGNSNYSIGHLDNPANDAQDLANTLRAIGFETTIRLNQDGEGMKNTIREFGEKLKNNDGIALFFFAGHGIQANGENYLLPVGFPFRNEQEVEKNAVPANMVLRYMEDSKNRVNLVVLDACRNNPFIKTRTLKVRGLAPMDAPSGTLVAFSTAPGTEASDGAGRNGLYTKHLMANLKVPGMTVEQVFKRTREGVEIESEKEIGRKQSPREESSLKGSDVYFIQPLAAAKPGSAATPEQYELAYWNSIASSSNSADFESYLSQYPQGKFVELARNKLQATKSPQSGRNESRAMGDGSAAPSYATSRPATVVASARPGKVFSSPGNFSFEDDQEGTVKAAEFLSISCRDILKNKRIRLSLEDKSRQGAAFRRALEQTLLSTGVRIAASGGAADLIIKGVIETTSGVNQVLRIGEIDLQADFTLTSTNGKTLSMASASGGAYTGSNSQNAARGVWEEKSEEIVGKLLKDYCSGK
ncbi:MAG TPA: caspase family protein [Rhodocyclaceae bacterium]|nr:caspase family protein [Rhodocyclaceae bacterium]